MYSVNCQNMACANQDDVFLTYLFHPYGKKKLPEKNCVAHFTLSALPGLLGRTFTQPAGTWKEYITHKSATMKSTEKLKTAIITVAIILSCGTANAQRPRHRHHHPYQVVKMMPSPAVTIRISNHFTQKERFKNPTYL